MPLTAIVVSKDRAAQLDLLLRSVTCHAVNLVDSVAVVWDCSDTKSEEAYSICRDDHPNVDFYKQDHFLDNIVYQVEQADNYAMFLTDDSYFYRDMPDVDPCSVLSSEMDSICFSLRLGKNTCKCYPLKGRWQRFPDFEDGGGYLVWDWSTADADFGYPGSMDGHIFRKKDLLRIVHDDDHWWNPNTFEDVMCSGVYKIPRSSMTCLYRSVLVGIPANRTSGSHPGNRYGEKYFVDHEWLNTQYLSGHRIKFPDVPNSWINAAHAELNLELL